MQWLNELWAGGDRIVQISVATVCIIAVLVALAILYRVAFANRLRVPGGRTRQPRLGLVDAFSLDGQRQLVLVRRDNVEHLVMIGGPNDVLIESQINRALALPRDSTVAAPGPTAAAVRRPSEPASFPPAATPAPSPIPAPTAAFTPPAAASTPATAQAQPVVVRPAMKPSAAPAPTPQPPQQESPAPHPPAPEAQEPEPSEPPRSAPEAVEAVSVPPPERIRRAMPPPIAPLARAPGAQTTPPAANPTAAAHPPAGSNAASPQPIHVERLDRREASRPSKSEVVPATSPFAAPTPASRTEAAPAPRQAEVHPAPQKKADDAPPPPPVAEKPTSAAPEDPLAGLESLEAEMAKLLGREKPG